MFTQQNRDELETRGVTMVPNVIPLEDCDRHQEYFRQWLSKFPDGEWPQSKNSLIQRYKTGFMPPAWEVRLSAKKVFSQIWGTEKLLSSIDAIAIGRPPEAGQEAFWQEGDNWLHFDQRADRVGLHAYQGAVYLEEAAEEDWAFEVIEGSNRHFAEFSDRTQQWMCKKIRDPDIDWFSRKGCKRKRIPCPKGGMLLWDSRLAHANTRPIETRENGDRWRYVVFVCMAPASWATSSDLHLKRRSYEGMKLTTHWPCEEVYMFPSIINKGNARDPGGMERLPDIALTEEVQRLVGVLPYEEKDDDEPEPDYRPQWDREKWRTFIEEFNAKTRTEDKPKGGNKKKRAFRAK